MNFALGKATFKLQEENMKRSLILVVALLLCGAALQAADLDAYQAIALSRKNLAEACLARFTPDVNRGYRIAFAYQARKNSLGKMEGPVYADCVIEGTDLDDTFVRKNIRINMKPANNGKVTVTEFLPYVFLCEGNGKFMDYILKIKVNFVFISKDLEDKTTYDFNFEDLSQVLSFGDGFGSYQFFVAKKPGFAQSLDRELMNRFLSLSVLELY